MFLQVNLVTSEVEKVNHKERGQTGEQMELDALTSISASLPLQKGSNHQHTNPFPKRNTRQGSKSEATEREQSISPSLTMQQVKIQSYLSFLNITIHNLFWICCSYFGFLYHLIELAINHNQNCKKRSKGLGCPIICSCCWLILIFHFQVCDVPEG